MIVLRVLILLDYLIRVNAATLSKYTGLKNEILVNFRDMRSDFDELAFGRSRNLKSVLHRSSFASEVFLKELLRANELSESLGHGFVLRLACDDACLYNRSSTNVIEIDLDTGTMNCEKLWNTLRE